LENGPEGVSVHTTRLKLVKVSVKELKETSRNTVEAAKLLATANVDIIVYGCTSGTLIGGVKWEEGLRRFIEEATGIMTIATAFAIVEALRALNVRKVAVVTVHSRVIVYCLLCLLSGSLRFMYLLPDYGSYASSVPSGHPNPHNSHNRRGGSQSVPHLP